MTTTRTDAHRPSAVDFDPATYEWTGVVVDFTPQDGDNGDWPIANTVIRELEREGYTFATAHAESIQCQHCGAHLRYAALLKHDATKEILWVGETCLDNRFSGMTKAQFDHLRKTAMLAREAAAKLAAFNEFLANHPEIVPATYITNLPHIDSTGWAVGVVQDILHRLRQYGSISEKQIAFVIKLVAEVEEKIANYTEPVPNGPAPRGKQTIEGEIVGYKTVEGYAYGSSVLKMIVKLGNGSRVYGTSPTSLFDANKGSRVRFTATFEAPQDGAEDFAFFKRPTKAEIVEVI